LEAVDAASEVLYLKHLLVLQSEMQDLADARARLIDSDIILDQTNVRLTDKVAAELAAAELRTERRETRRKLAVARLRLARAIGAPPEMDFNLADELQVPMAALIPVEVVIELARQRSPEFAAAGAAIEETFQRCVQARAEAVPDFELGPRYQDELDADGTDRLGVRFATDVPIFDRNQAAIAREAAQMRADQANAFLAEHNAASDAAALYHELENLREDWQNLQATTRQMKARCDKLFSDPVVRRGVPEAQTIRLKQQLLRQKALDLTIRQRFFQVRHSLEVLVGQPIVVGAP
jgi:outer membrane protein TolC